MKRGLIVLFLICMFSFPFVSAIDCNLGVTMLNQDPYPAVPGDYVEIVFQLTGVENPSCGLVFFSLVEKYPLVFDPGMDPVVDINSGTFSKDFSSSKIIPYKVRVDEDAVDGNNPVEVSFSSKGVGDRFYQTKEFKLNIKNTKADFEIFVKDYDAVNDIITFEILNIADVDVEALTLEIPAQEGVVVKGSKRNILGDLDSNEYTSTDFELTSSVDEIVVNVFYTDNIGVRRELRKTVAYESDYFVGRNAGATGMSKWAYAFWLVVILVGVYFGYKKYKKKRHHHKA